MWVNFKSHLQMMPKHVGILGKCLLFFYQHPHFIRIRLICFVLSLPVEEKTFLHLLLFFFVCILAL